MNNDTASIVGTLLIIGTVGGLVLFGMFGWPHVRIYRQNLAGQATLREAEWTKKILIEEAKAEKEAAILQAEAEVERAKGVAQANEIIGAGLKGNEEYLRYLWIQGLQDNQSEVVYIPTEAGLPILEAGGR